MPLALKFEIIDIIEI